MLPFGINELPHFQGGRSVEIKPRRKRWPSRNLSCQAGFEFFGLTESRRQQHHWEKAIIGQVFSTLNPCMEQDQGCRVCGACQQTVLRRLAPSAKGSIMPPIRLGRRGLQACLVLLTP